MISTSRPETLDIGNRVGANGLMEAFVEVATRHGRSISPIDILSRLPYSAQGVTLSVLNELAAALDFEVHLARLSLQSVPAITLPVILFDADGRAIVLTKLSIKRNEAAIVAPQAGRTEQRLKLSDLSKQHSGVVVFLQPKPQHSSVSEPVKRARKDHWFWSTFKVFWRDYTQVVFAAFLINLVGIAAPLFIKNVYDRVIPNLAIPTLWALTSGVLIALLIDVALRTLRSSVVDQTGRRVDLAVAGRLFDRLLNLRLESRPPSAGALASQLRDFDSVRDILTSSTLIAVTDLFFIGIFIAVMWLFVGPLALVPLAAVGVVLICALLVQVPLARAVRASQADGARRHGVLVEAAGSVETIKSIGAERYLRRVWNDAVVATSRSTTQARFWANLSTNMVVFVNQAVSIFTVVWGVFLVLDGSITVGSLIAASILSGRVLAPLGGIVQTLARAHQAWSAFRTLDTLMSAPSEPATSGDGRSPRVGDIHFKNISLIYPGASIAALSDVSFTINKGERVGLIGRIGSGKTSVGRLLAGLYEPCSGQILIDGMDVRQFGADLRSLVGFCPQETELFSATLRDNIVIGRPEATSDAIERVVRITGIDLFAARQPLGLAMPVAERGRSLSGGQRQAIGLARVLIREPKVLFLDEPSSAMDTASERMLVANLKRELTSDTTLLISTHRDGLLELVDRLLVFEGGRIIADGPKDEVLARLREATRIPVIVKAAG